MKLNGLVLALAVGLMGMRALTTDGRRYVKLPTQLKRADRTNIDSMKSAKIKGTINNSCGELPSALDQLQKCGRVKAVEVLVASICI